MTGPSTLLGAARVRSLLDTRGIKPRKALGQNFVIDPNTIRKVIDATEISAGDPVLEIGPGVGSLTVGLLDAGASVTAIEVDERLVPILEEVTRGRAVRIVCADALQTDLGSVSASALVANLPYNVAATIVIKVLETAPGIDRAVVMTQREVGERFVAPPGSKVYGITSVLAGFHAEVELAGRISRRAFYPVPNVDSVLVRFRRRSDRDSVAPEAFGEVVKTAFGQRRKTMRQSIAPLAGSPEAAESLLIEAGVDPQARPEQLQIASFVELARVLSEARDGGPA